MFKNYEINLLLIDNNIINTFPAYFAISLFNFINAKYIIFKHIWRNNNNKTMFEK